MNTIIIERGHGKTGMLASIQIAIFNIVIKKNRKWNSRRIGKRIKICKKLFPGNFY